MKSIIEWWRTERRSPIKFNRRSITLSAPYTPSGARGLSVASLYVDGLIQGSVAPMAERFKIIPHEDALEHFRAAGFVGGPDWPSFDGDPAKADHRDRLLQLLVWADDLIRAADASGRPHQEG
jgi:hypothetical protein